MRHASAAIAWLALTTAVAAGGSAYGSGKAKVRKGYPDKPPHQPNGRCFLSIDGKAKIDGPCLIADTDKDGSFYFDDNRMVMRCAYKGAWCGGAAYAITRYGVFGALNTNPKAPADLSWNEGKASHAQSDLGPVVRNGDCWIGRSRGWPRVKLCTWKTKNVSAMPPPAPLG